MKELDLGDAEEFIRLTHSTITPSEFEENVSKENAVYAGVRVGERLVSAGRCLILRATGGIPLSVRAEEPFRNRGYGTSLVSYLTERVLREGRFSTLLVEGDNTAAIHLHEKIGYLRGMSVFMCSVSS